MGDAQRPDANDSRGQARLAQFGPFRFDLEGGILVRGNQEIPLSPKAAGVLRCLVEGAGRVVPKQELLDRVWGEGTLVADRSLSEAIGILRQALQDDPQSPGYIQTVHRRGYRFVAAIESASGRPGAGSIGSVRPSAWRSSVAWALVLVAAVAVVAAYLATRPRPGAAADRAARRVMMALPEDVPVAPERPLPFVPALAISADGKRVAYVSRPGQGQAARLFIKRMDRFAPIAVASSDGAAAPFFSPDGNWVAFFGGEVPQTLTKARTDGGTPVPLVDVEVGLGGFWHGDWIYYVPGHSIGIHKVAATGGEPVAVTVLDRERGEEEHVWPQVLPDGETLLFVARSETELRADARVVLQRLDTGERRILVEGSDYARYLPGGYVAFTRDGGLFARTFDLVTGTLGDREARLLAEDPIGRRLDVSTLATSDTGTLLAAPRNSFLRPVWFDRAGGATPMPLESRSCQLPGLSPDETRVAFSCTADGEMSVWVHDIGRGTLTRMTHGGAELVPVWAPDGGSITYGTRDGDRWSIRRVATDGTGKDEPVLDSDYPIYPQTWTPDGETLIYQEIHPRTGEDIWSWSATERVRRPVLITDANESGARLSPDGRFLAYHAWRSGTWSIFLRPFPALDREVQVSIRPGGWPAWSPHGDELVYLSAPMGRVMAATFDAAEAATGRPRVLFELDRRLLGDRKGPVYELTTGGHLLAVEIAGGPLAELHLILDWDVELAALLAGEG